MKTLSNHIGPKGRAAPMTATGYRPQDYEPIDFARLAHNILKTRRARRKYFDPELFADPAWDILLDLRAHHGDGRTVASLFVAESAPISTGLRHLRRLQRRGLVERWTDPSDARRRLARLSDRGLSLIDQCLALMLG